MQGEMELDARVGATDDKCVHTDIGVYIQSFNCGGFSYRHFIKIYII